MKTEIDETVESEKGKDDEKVADEKVEKDDEKQTDSVGHPLKRTVQPLMKKKETIKDEKQPELSRRTKRYMDKLLKRREVESLDLRKLEFKG